MKTKNVLIILLLNLSASVTAYAQARAAVTRTAVVKTIPKSRVTVYNGVNYHYANGIYYRPYQGGYTVVRPPIGIHINVLPAGFASITFGGIPYYYLGDVYYVQQQPNVYQVVEKPAGLIVPDHPASEMISQLPNSAESIIINGKHYYRINDTYYEKIVSENGESAYRTVGKKE